MGYVSREININTLSPIYNAETITAQSQFINEYIYPELESLIAAHNKASFEWFPSEFLPSSRNMNSLQEEEMFDFKEQCKALPDGVRVALVLNLLTEEGLPFYHRLLHEAFGNNESWRIWKNQWTAEEDRHGNILRDIIRDGRLLDFTAVEKMQFNFIRQGWAPDWSGNPYRTLAYTSFQEHATQMSHLNLGKIIKKTIPKLSKIFSCIAGDEMRHFKFYASIVKKLLIVDPKGMLEALLATLKEFKMPGHEMQGFSEMAQIEHSLNIFGPKEFSTVITKVINFIDLLELDSLDNYCEELRQKILNYPKRLLQAHNRFINNIDKKAKHFKFTFL